MYHTEEYTATIAVKDYVRDYVDVETFLDCCKACPNYNAIWSCPSYDFDVIEYWNQYEHLDLTAVKIIFDETIAGKPCTKEEFDDILEKSLRVEKKKLSQMLFEKEKQNPGTVSLSAGSCTICTNGCTRSTGEPCRFPEQMRYSIESIGGNVGLTISKLMGLQLEWMEEGVLPKHFILVCGLLRP